MSDMPITPTSTSEASYISVINKTDKSLLNMSLKEVINSPDSTAIRQESSQQKPAIAMEEVSLPAGFSSFKKDMCVFGTTLEAIIKALRKDKPGNDAFTFGYKDNDPTWIFIRTIGLHQSNSKFKHAINAADIKSSQDNSIPALLIGQGQQGYPGHARGFKLKNEKLYPFMKVCIVVFQDEHQQESYKSLMQLQKEINHPHIPLLKFCTIEQLEATKQDNLPPNLITLWKEKAQTLEQLAAKYPDWELNLNTESV